MAWLLNTGNLANLQDLSEYKEVESSVVNYGMRDLCGLTASGIDPMDVQEWVAQTIRAYEPRILPHTLIVRAVAEPDEYHEGNMVGFEIEGELWAKPMNEALFIKTELDLETGDFKVKEAGR